MGVGVDLDGIRYDAAVTVIRQNGAWLIEMSDPTNDSTPDQLVTCAGSLDLAKRIGRAMAEEFGWINVSRQWRRDKTYPEWWNLAATWEEE